MFCHLIKLCISFCPLVKRSGTGSNHVLTTIIVRTINIFFKMMCLHQVCTAKHELGVHNSEYLLFLLLFLFFFTLTVFWLLPFRLVKSFQVYHTQQPQQRQPMKQDLDQPKSGAMRTFLILELFFSLFLPLITSTHHSACRGHLGKCNP